MHGASGTVLWVSIVASAIVAALITLLIEYVAKPSLEARKERILERHRQFRSALRGLERAKYVGDQISDLRKHLDLEYFRNRVMQFAEELEPLVDKAVEVIDVPASLEYDWGKCAGLAIGFRTLVQARENDDSMWNLFNHVVKKLNNYCDLFDTPRTRWLRRRKLIQEIRSHPLPD